MTKFYLVAYKSDDPPDSEDLPIGGLHDVFGASEFPDDLMEYMNHSSFYADGHIFFVEDSNIFIYAECSGWEWNIFDVSPKLEDYTRVRLLG